MRHGLVFLLCLLGLLTLEVFSHTYGSFFEIYLPVLWRENRSLILHEGLGLGAKVLLLYGGLWAVICLTIGRSWLVRLQALLFTYMGVLIYTQSQLPWVSGSYRWAPWKISLALFSVTLFIGLGVRIKSIPWNLKKKPVVIASLIVIFFFVFSKSRLPLSPPRPLHSTLPSLPNIVLLGLDSVSQSSLTEQAFPRLYEELGPDSIQFLEAYTSSNSTLGTWQAILSGKDAFNSPIQTLFPHISKRRAQVQDHALLPQKMKQQGYTTVFMTDCATTSFMDPQEGWDKIIQPPPGTLACGKSLLAGRFQLTAFVNEAFNRPVFKEHLNFCSPLYNPSTFFKQAAHTYLEFTSQKQPVFFALHSCATHHNLVQRSLAPKTWKSRFRATSLQTMKLQETYKLADSYIPLFLSATLDEDWIVFFSDHGNRKWESPNAPTFFSHAWGLPKDRDQYRVPLWIRPPAQVDLQNPHTRQVNPLVSLTRLHFLIPKFGQTVIPLSSQVLNDFKTLEVEELMLSSALPFESPKKQYLKSLSQNTTLTPQGLLHFKKRFENQMMESASVALLKPPYRYLFSPPSKVEKFHEYLDPRNQHALSLSRGETQRIVSLFCDRGIRSPSCRTDLAPPRALP